MAASPPKAFEVERSDRPGRERSIEFIFGAELTHAYRMIDDLAPTRDPRHTVVEGHGTDVDIQLRSEAPVETSAKSRSREVGLRVTTAVEWDYPAHEAVIRAATRFRADLIIADCHSGPHHAPWLLHFPDWELLRNSPVPVLLVKNRRPYRRVPGIDSMAPPAGVEPTTYRLGGGRSIH